MSIQYRLTEKSDNINANPKKGYYAQVVTRGTVDTNEMCRIISSRSSLTAADIKATLEALVGVIEEKLGEGYNICINELGTFSVSSETNKEASLDDVLTGEHVRVKNINYRPSVRMKKSLSSVTFEFISETK